MTLGQLVEARRAELGESPAKPLSQAEAGRRMGVDQSAVSRWEKGKGAPERTAFPAVAAFLQISELELIALINEFYKDLAAQRRVAAKSRVMGQYERLGPEAKARIAMQIEAELAAAESVVTDPGQASDQ